MAEKEQADGFFAKTLRILAYPAAAAAAFWTARVNISDAAYDQIKNYGGFAKIKEGETRQEFIDRAIKDGKDNLLDHRKQSNQVIKERILGAVWDGEHNVKGENIITDIKQEREGLYKAIEGRKKTIGIKGVMDEWGIMHRSQKQMTFINTITIGAVTLGALIAASNLKIFRHAGLVKDDDKNPPSVSP